MHLCSLLVTEIVTVLEQLGNLIQTAGSGGEEAEEGLAGCQDTADVLGVELHTDIPGVVLKLEDFHTLASLVFSDECETGLF